MKRFTAAAASAAITAPLLIAGSLMSATPAQAGNCDSAYPAGGAYAISTLPKTATVRKGATFQLLARLTRSAAGGSLGCNDNFILFRVHFSGVPGTQSTQPIITRYSASKLGNGWAQRTYTANRTFVYYGLFRSSRSAVGTIAVR